MSFTHFPLATTTLWHFESTDSSQSSPELDTYANDPRSLASENGIFGRKRLYQGQDGNENHQAKRAREDPIVADLTQMDDNMIDEEQMAQEFFEAGYEADCEDNEECGCVDDFDESDSE